MTKIIPDMLDPRVVSAMDENMFTVFDALVDFPGLEWHDTDELKACVSDIPHPLFNMIMRARLDADNVEATVKRIAHRARDKGYGALWRVDEASTPQDLDYYLLKYGFRDVGNEPGMAVNLSDQQDKIKLTDGVALRLLADESQLETFVTTVLKGFEMPKFLHEPMCSLWRAGGLDESSNFRHYYATLHGEMVGTGTLFLGGGVAGIYNITTLEQARRRGIGEAITRQLMQAGFEQGYKVGILQASEMGQGIYERIGFEVVCNYRDYVYPQS